MPYTDRFRATDNLIAYLIPITGKIIDPGIKAHYAGFISVSSVTGYELAIKDIFTEFASKKNKVFGTAIAKHFEKINGRIKIEELKGSHIKLFGDKYLVKFKRILQNKEKRILKTSKINISAAYDNLIICRHKYVHNGTTTLTIKEAIDNFKNGKEIINCINEALKR